MFDEILKDLLMMTTNEQSSTSNSQTEEDTNGEGLRVPVPPPRLNSIRKNS